MSDEMILADIKKAIADNTIVLFAKGTKEAPRCGFSARTIQLFQEIGRPFAVVDILADPAIRQVLSAHFAQFSDEPGILRGEPVLQFVQRLDGRQNGRGNCDGL